MKKSIQNLLFTLCVLLGFNANALTNELDNNPNALDSKYAMLQEGTQEETQEETTKEVEKEEVAEAVVPTPEVEKEDLKFHQIIKKKFIEGGAMFMGIVLVALILGLAIAIERVIYLGLSSINSKKFIEEIDEILAKGNVEEAKELCRNTRGPIASIYYQGLDRLDEGLDMIEKSVISYGGVQMGLLEKNISWITLFIALAPMLGFMGTVIGMIQAFDTIESAGEISASLVAGGIKVALLTTVFGLIVAMILQLFYNYIIAKVDNLVNKMEDASIILVDLIIKHKLTK